ncbi:hypothetical protein [Massilia sp. CT11-137]|uniref:hypothetical protein n=1 Tax=Massilia sp. CT11-137 TaxID=3393901 RepID=UPI0039B03C12
MNQTTTAGIDLDKLEALARELRGVNVFTKEHFALADKVTSGALQLIDLARRAEPSVTEATNERALDKTVDEPSKFVLGFWIEDGCIEFTKGDFSTLKDGTYHVVTAPVLASPAVSQKDGAAVEPIGYVSREQMEWLERKGEINSPSVQLWKGKVPLDAMPVYASPAATTASSQQRCYGATRADQQCPCATCSAEKDATASVSFASDGKFLNLLSAHQAAELACDQDGSDNNREASNEAWEALIAYLDSCAPAPSRDAALDRLVCKVARENGPAIPIEAARAIVAALARAPLPAQENSNEALAGRTVSVDVSTCDDDAGNRIFAELTGETGSDGTTLIAIETSRNFAAPAQAGDARDAALFRKVVELGIQLHFEGGDGEDDAVWVNCLMKWADGDRLGATRELVEQEAKNLAAMSASQGKKGGVA